MLKNINDDFSVTVVITTFNRPVEAIRALESVLNQSYRNIEIIVIEDGSNSSLKDWIFENRPFDIPVKYVNNYINKGLAATRNHGYRIASNPYVAFLDDDDFWKPEKIELQIELLKGLDESTLIKMGVVYCGVEIRDMNNNIRHIIQPQNLGNLKNAIISQGANTPSSSLLFPKSVLEEIGGFDEILKSSIDHDIWMNLAANGYSVCAVNDPLVISYERDNRKTMMNDTFKRVQGVKEYVEKWTPTYQEWFGKIEGKLYGQRYFTNVISRMAAQKLLNGQFKEFLKSIKSINLYSEDKKYNRKTILVDIVKITLKRIMPRKILDRIKNLKTFKSMTR